MGALGTENNHLFFASLSAYSMWKPWVLFQDAFVCAITFCNREYSEKKFWEIGISQDFTDNPYLTFKARKENLL